MPDCRIPSAEAATVDQLLLLLLPLLRVLLRQLPLQCASITKRTSLAGMPQHAVANKAAVQLLCVAPVLLLLTLPSKYYSPAEAQSFNSKAFVKTSHTAAYCCCFSISAANLIWYCTACHAVSCSRKAL
jgi:hypothetical protein